MTDSTIERKRPYQPLRPAGIEECTCGDTYAIDVRAIILGRQDNQLIAWRNSHADHNPIRPKKKKRRRPW